MRKRVTFVLAITLMAIVPCAAFAQHTPDTEPGDEPALGTRMDIPEGMTTLAGISLNPDMSQYICDIVLKEAIKRWNLAENRQWATYTLIPAGKQMCRDADDPKGSEGEPKVIKECENATATHQQLMLQVRDEGLPMRLLSPDNSAAGAIYAPGQVVGEGNTLAQVNAVGNNIHQHVTVGSTDQSRREQSANEAQRQLNPVTPETAPPGYEDEDENPEDDPDEGWLGFWEVLPWALVVLLLAGIIFWWKSSSKKMDEKKEDDEPDPPSGGGDGGEGPEPSEDDTSDEASPDPETDFTPEEPNPAREPGSGDSFTPRLKPRTEPTPPSVPGSKPEPTKPKPDPKPGETQPAPPEPKDPDRPLKASKPEAKPRAEKPDESSSVKRRPKPEPPKTTIGEVARHNEEKKEPNGNGGRK